MKYLLITNLILLFLINGCGSAGGGVGSTLSNITVRAVNKSGNAIAATKFVTGNEDNTNDDTERTTNGVGEFTVKAPNGKITIKKYEDETHGSSATVYKNTNKPSITKVDGTTNYDITVPQLIYSDAEITTSGRRAYGCSVTGGSPGCFSTDTQYVAQAITPSSSITACGIGIGVQITHPNSIKIYSDSSSEPDSELASKTITVTYIESLAVVEYTSDGQSGSYVDFCDGGTGIDLTGGVTYWIVAVYDSVPGAINVRGHTSMPNSGLNVKTSPDGTTWSNANMYNGTNKLDLWVHD